MVDEHGNEIKEITPEGVIRYKKRGRPKGSVKVVETSEAAHPLDPRPAGLAPGPLPPVRGRKSIKAYRTLVRRWRGLGKDEIMGDDGIPEKVFLYNVQITH